ncbi:MAG: type II toxin-antitoxin system death-on-curing family toxin [Acidobacteria bacterium]|nr:MAG: type II toxin-antitoxin system death-on-curing family toxin [Acidobacteriota bacterium]
MKQPNWIDPRALLLLHGESLAEHGGSKGLRDENAFHSALARPQHVFRYKPDAGMAQLAGAYGFGLIRDHPFNDGNKRVGFLAILLFLDLNGFELNVDQIDAIQTIMNVAGGELSETELTNWIRTHLRRAKDEPNQHISRPDTAGRTPPINPRSQRRRVGFPPGLPSHP